MTVSFNPVGSWFVVAVFAVVVTVLTLWAYSLRLRSTTGAWRWFALGLRLAAILLCVIAALRPSVVFQEKKKSPASLLFLVDDSTSMTITDEVGGQSRWDVARKHIKEARATSKTLGEGLNVKFYRFDSTLRDDPDEEKDRTKDTAKTTNKPQGRQTALGQALLDAFRRESGMRVASLVLLSDGANNSGISPLVAARELKGQQVPVVSVGFGSPDAGKNSRDIAIRELIAGPTVFVKNQLQVKGTLLVRGFDNETLDLEMRVEGQETPVATRRIKVPPGTEILPITGLKYVPQTPGEKQITLSVSPKENELVKSNNTVSTFISVLKGGLNVLFVQGPHSPWEQKFWLRSVASSPDIQADLRIIRKPARGDVGELKDEEFAPGRYDVYVLSDLPAAFLTPTQQALLARAVERGAGLIMLGGRSSFGAGGWARTEVANVLPVTMSPRDGQIEPEGGIKFVPNKNGLENFLFQIGSTRPESDRIWASLPPLSGINHLGSLKTQATVFAFTPGDHPEPIMVGSEAGKGRVLAFGGETWVWTRTFEDIGRMAHRKFWRQVIFWLAHKEDKGDNDVKLTLDSRRIASGQKLDFTVTAKDTKGEPIKDVKIETKVETDGPPIGEGAKKVSEAVESFDHGQEHRGSFFARQSPPGVYRMSAVATRNGKEVGRDSARFLIYQDDRELENPAADLSLLRQIADASGGETLPPEKLPAYLQSLKGKVFTESSSLTERKVWDNWPFLLLFTSLLTLEWFIRKRHGWV